MECYTSSGKGCSLLEKAIGDDKESYIEKVQPACEFYNSLTTAPTTKATVEATKAPKVTKMWEPVRNEEQTTRTITVVPFGEEGDGGRDCQADMAYKCMERGMTSISSLLSPLLTEIKKLTTFKPGISWHGVNVPMGIKDRRRKREVGRIITRSLGPSLPARPSSLGLDKIDQVQLQDIKLNDMNDLTDFEKRNANMDFDTACQ